MICTGVFLLMEQACDKSPVINPDLWAWIEDHVGPYSRGWTVARSPRDDDGYWFYFKDPQAAMLFKLTWA